MKKMSTLIFLAGAYVVFGANDTDDVHISNIERAIVGLPAMLSNSLGTVRYDFTAIQREIKIVKDERLRVGLLEKSIQPLFLVDGKQWKNTPQTELLRKRESMLEESFALTEGAKYIVLRWLNRLKMYQSMKQELAFYADAEPPDEEALKNHLLQDFTEEIERRKAKASGKTIVFSRSVPMPKKWRDASARMGYKKWLQSHIRFYEKDNFDALKFKVDYEDLPDKEKQPLMEKVRKELGRYPKWYQPDDGEKAEGDRGF